MVTKQGARASEGVSGLQFSFCCEGGARQIASRCTGWGSESRCRSMCRLPVPGAAQAVSHLHAPSAQMTSLAFICPLRSGFAFKMHFNMSLSYGILHPPTQNKIFVPSGFQRELLEFQHTYPSS